jgi:DNA-binding NtrC family response regulator
VLPLTIPPLRARREDIPHLVRHFMTRIAAEENRPVTSVSGEAMAMLGQLAWPGNVRQLENAVYRAVVMSDGGQLGADDFQTGGMSPAPVSDAEPVVIDSPPSSPGETVAGAEIPIAPSPAPAGFMSAYGTLSMLGEDGEMRALADMEAETIRFAIAHYRGQMSEVARRLKIGRSTLYRKLDEAAASGTDSGLSR